MLVDWFKGCPTFSRVIQLNLESILFVRHFEVGDKEFHGDVFTNLVVPSAKLNGESIEHGPNINHLLIRKCYFEIWGRAQEESSRPIEPLDASNQNKWIDLGVLN